ncbi:SusC/RagA family TonB-linked outer membrane protein [Tenacibaculum finnmarkense]|nr:SusC/RagA family TonB-linked outer membrane protein [Tenacibaculum finnmarkense]
MNPRYKNVLCILFFLGFLVNVSAQQKMITGTVSDSAGPLPGVNVVIKGTVTGAETDFDGTYTVKASAGQRLVFSFVGMQNITKLVGAKTTINVVMQEDANVLEEVVVVGYGTSTKSAFTGTAKVVKAEVLAAKSVSNISQALAGEAAGVQVINTSGQPGASATIRIRGFGSVNGNRDPLFVVDGVPFDGALNTINPSDIASTTILKDATATAIYGSRGANGVVLITTKSGKNGVSSIELDVKTGVNFSNLARYSTIKSPEEYIGLSWEAMRNKGDFNGEADATAYANANLFSGKGVNSAYNLWNVSDVSKLIDPATGKVRAGVARKYTPENWADYGFQTSIRTEANLKMSGGDDKTKYFSSFGYLEDKGYVLNSDYKRYTSRLNLTHNPTDWLKASVNLGYTFGKTTSNGQSEDSGSVFWFVDNIPSIYPLFTRDTNGKKIDDPIYGGHVYDFGDAGRGFGALTNSIANAKYNLKRSERHSLNANFSFNFQLAENLSFESRYGAQYYSFIDNNIQNPFYGSAAGGDTKGRLFKQNRYAVTQNFLNMFKYNTSFGDHKVDFIAAHESNQWKRQRGYTDVKRVVNLNNGLDDPTNYVETAGKSTGYREETAIESFFGQANYNYDGKYFFTTSVRRDGTSRFKNNKWGTFGSIGGSWIVTKENFMNDVEFVNNLKVKVSYGILGDQSIGSRLSDLYAGQNGYNIENLGGQISLPVRARQNAELTWETSKMFQTGVEFTLFDNLVDASFDYYVKNTEDLIFDRRLGPSIGDALEKVNDGKLKNAGFEFDITTHIINKKNYTFDVSLNGEFLKNELTQMPIDPSTGKAKLLDQSGNYGRSKGHSLFDYYMREWAGVDANDGAAMWNVNYVDANKNDAFDKGEEIKNYNKFLTDNPDAKISQGTTKVYSQATQKYVDKSAIPTVRGAFRLSAKIHDFDISSQFAYSLGGYAYDGAYANLMSNGQVGGNNWSTDMRDRWQKKGDITNVPRLYSNEVTAVTSSSTRFLTSTDYLALNNIRVGYTIPVQYIKKAGLGSVNLYASGDNLFLLSKRDGFNPATSETGSSDQYRYSPLTTFAFGVRIKF